jgi:hypothetical protein
MTGKNIVCWYMLNQSNGRENDESILAGLQSLAKNLVPA